MPQRLKHRCRYPGCPEVVRARFCAEHAQCDNRRSDHRRGTSSERGYDARWSRLADYRRQRDAYLCQPCLAEQRLMEARIVDHIIPLHIRPDWRLEFGNTQVICSPCHQRKTARDTQRYGSSTTQRLTAQQQAERHIAQGLLHPPRSDDSQTPGGDLETLPKPRKPHVSQHTRAREIGVGGVLSPECSQPLN